MKRVLLVVVLTPVVLFFGLLLGAPLLPNRMFYRDRRPTRLGRLVNGVFALLYQLPGLPNFIASLETTGRRTGRAYTIPVAIADYDGERYLVSMLGERSGWVPNIRAAGGRAVIKHGRRRDVILEEVPVQLRAPIIKAYVRRAPGGRPHIPLSPDEPVEAFERIAGEYPVFRITPAPGV